MRLASDPLGTVRPEGMLTKHKDSHLDHGLTEAQIAWILEQGAGWGAPEGVRIETLELPEKLGTVPCALRGPVMGDDPIPEARVRYARRGDRAGLSRFVIDLEPVATCKVTVIAGPHDGLPCVVYTAFGGPLAPKEPWDASPDEKEASQSFWTAHALAGSV